MNDRNFSRASTETGHTLNEIDRCPTSRKTSGMSRARVEAKRDFNRASRRLSREIAREAKRGE